MTALKLGELCAGYGGLGMAVEEVFNAETAWFSEYDSAPSKILAHHWPGVPNYGDMTKIDWAAIEPVDIISGGTPCQDLSHAGARKGMTEGTRSNLWVQMREAIAIQRPQYVVWENVRGAYSAEADSGLEQCPGCMGDTADRGTVLRALGRVLGDLSDLGYDCQWRGLRAADVGACHGRFRVFVLAANRDRIGHERAGSSRGRRAGLADLRELTADSDRQGLEVWGDAGLIPGSSRDDSPAAFRNQEPTPDAESLRRGERRAESARKFWRLATARNQSSAAHTDRAGGKTLSGRSGAWDAGRREPVEHHGADIEWGDYEPAIRRWEARLGRPAPRPTEPTGRNNGERLSPRFTEWMMGLPDGWVTDPAIGISRNEQLKACGNGVVPQQAIAALQDMLASIERRNAA